MKEGKITYLSSIKSKILTDCIPLLLKNNLIFTDKFFSVGIKDFKNEIVQNAISSFGVFNTKSRKRIGVLDFSDSSFSRLKAKDKIIWKIFVDDLSFEKEAIYIVNAIQSMNSKIRVRIIANSKR